MYVIDILLLIGQSPTAQTAHPTISESMLLRDVIYVFQGIDGKYVKYDASVDSFVVDVEVWEMHCFAYWRMG